MIKRSVFLFILVSLLWACGGMSDPPEEILGQWKTHEWTIDQTGARISGKMDFTFDKDGGYQVDYGTQKEIGVFRVDGDRLYTTENGQARKYVKIKKLTKDSLIFGMNRAGRLETVVLIKSKKENG